jgi:hypothetical protein
MKGMLTESTLPWYFLLPRNLLLKIASVRSYVLGTTTETLSLMSELLVCKPITSFKKKYTG